VAADDMQCESSTKAAVVIQESIRLLMSVQDTVYSFFCDAAGQYLPDPYDYARTLTKPMDISKSNYEDNDLQPP
jgi:hypothetical protein